MSNIELFRNGLKGIIKSLEKIEKPTIEEQLKLRNLKRHLIISQANKSPKQVFVWCEMVKAEISELMKCMWCPYGHILECHYPYDCSSEYCKHYKGDLL